MRYLIMCRSLTYAQRSQRLLEKSGIGCGIVKAPTGLSGNGCSYGVTVSEKNGKKAAELLRAAELLKGKIYKQDADRIIGEAVL